MTHQIYDAAVLAGLQPDKYGFEQNRFEPRPDLPEGAGQTVRTEVAAMLREIAADPPERNQRAGIAQRFRNWVPRFFLWLRAIPLP